MNARIDTTNNDLTFGFKNNLCQLSYHFVLSILIGLSLRMTIFQDEIIAPKIKSSHSFKYTFKTAFLISFGFTKALSNLVVGRISDLYGRKLPHSIGWVAGIFLGIMLLYTTKSADTSSDSVNSNTWTWLVIANIFLGFQQAFTWTTAIFMWMDILGPKNRALGSGISNSVGYLSNAITIYISASFSTEQAFYVVLASSMLGLAISLLGIKDTTDFVIKEVLEKPSILPTNDDTDTIEITTIDTALVEETDEDINLAACFEDEPDEEHKRVPYEMVSLSTESQSTTILHQPTTTTSSFLLILVQTCWYNKSTAILCVGGLFANLVTSLAWGLVLIWALQEESISIHRVRNISAGFDFSKAIMMILASSISDRRSSRKPILIGGFLTTTFGLTITALADWRDVIDVVDQVYYCLLTGGIITGCGIGSVYCVMAGALSDHSLATDRASAIGIYKLWRDSGYAVGGLLTGVLADLSGGSFIVTTLVVAALVGILVIFFALHYQEGSQKESD